MIAPRKIKFEAKKKRNENYEFHIFLKGNADEKDYSNAEQDCFRIVNKYLENTEIDYYVTPNLIFVFIENELIKINMTDFNEYIAIYKRYSGEKELYTSESKFKDLFVFSNRRTDFSFYHKLQYETSNLFVDIWLYDFNNIPESIKQDEINKIKEILQEIKDEASANSDKGYIFTAYIYTSEEDDGSRDIYKYEMSKEYFESEGKEMIAKCNRDQGHNFDRLGVQYGEDDEQNITLEIYYNGEFLEPDLYYEKLLEEENY